jgi:hypothetical protein
MVVSEIDHVSSMIASFTFPKRALLIDTKLLQLYLCYEQALDNWTETNNLQSLVHFNVVMGVTSGYSNTGLEYVAVISTHTGTV